VLKVIGWKRARGYCTAQVMVLGILNPIFVRKYIVQKSSWTLGMTLIWLSK